MILDLNETVKLCEKFKEITGDSISFDFEYFNYKSGTIELTFKIWTTKTQIINFKKLESLNSLIKLLIEEAEAINE